MTGTQRLAGRNVLVTGGTAGIGKATAVGLAILGARVAITGRDRVRAEAAAADIRAASGNPAVEVFTADMSSQAEVRRLAGAILHAYPRLDVLVNNVGGFWAHRHVTADGLEHTFALNHLQGTAAYSGKRAYSASKLANVMFTYELARRLEGTGVTATVLHPGVVRTNFGADDPAGLIKAMLPLVRPFMKTPAAGAVTTIYLASSVEVDGVTGRYFVDCRPKASTKVSYDTAVAAQLWHVSTQLVSLTTAPTSRGAA